ncbi:MAG: glycosyltransferase family 39 protein [Burkholderiales bacterium]
MTSLRSPAPIHTAASASPRAAPRARHWPGWSLCLGLAALWFGCTAWLRPLAIPDEGRYVGVAWEMLRSGDWLVPTLNGLPFFHKPPLFYWITATAMDLFGPGVAAARAAPWLSAVTIVTGVFAFVARWVGRPQAWLTAVILATVPLFYGAAQYANMDLLVAACVTSAILLTVHAVLARSAGSGYRPALAAAWAAMALGVLSKGLIGAVLPLLVLTAWALATRRLGKVLTLFTWGPGWLIFAAIAAPWFVLVQERFPAFDHYFFVVQHVERFVSTGFNNVQPWWFYLLALAALTLPWSPWVLIRSRRLPQIDSVASDVRILMRVWLAIVVLFFSLPSSKLVGYILPALAPLACLIAEVVWRATRATRALDRWLVATASVAAVGCVALVVAAHYGQPKSRQVLAETLGNLRQRGEPVFFLDNFYYDVMFYARIDAPVAVVDAWLPAEVAKDSWRRELVDAQHMAPASSQRRLLQTSELAPALCRAASSWVIGPWPASAARGWLTARPPLYQSGDTALWHIDASAFAIRSALECRGGLAQVSPEP